MLKIASRIMLAGTVSATAMAAQAEVIVGVVGPMTGQYASFFEQLTNGAKVAVERINADGGVNGEQLVLQIEDDACDPKQAVAVANKLAAAGAQAVFGHFCSAASIPASDIYDESGIVMINPAATSPMLTERGVPTVFRTAGRDDKQALVIADEIVRRKLGERIAIVHDKSTHGLGIAEGVKAALNERGIQEISFDSLTAGEKDFSTLVTTLKAQDPDVVYFGGYFAEAGLLVRQAREAGMTATFIGDDGVASSEFPSIAGKAADGFLMTFPPDPRQNPASAETVAAFREKGIEPEGYTLYTYAAVEVFDQAAEAAGATSGQAMVDALRDGSFDTVMGTLDFDEKGDSSTEPFILYKWEGATYTPLP